MLVIRAPFSYSVCVSFHIAKIMPIIAYAFERATGVLSKDGVLTAATERLTQSDYETITSLYKSTRQAGHADIAAKAMIAEDESHIREHGGGFLPSDLFQAFDDILTDPRAGMIEKITAAEGIVLAVGHLMGHDVKPKGTLDFRFQ